MFRYDWQSRYLATFALGFAHAMPWETCRFDDVDEHSKLVKYKLICIQFSSKFISHLETTNFVSPRFVQHETSTRIVSLERIVFECACFSPNQHTYIHVQLSSKENKCFKSFISVCYLSVGQTWIKCSDLVGFVCFQSTTLPLQAVLFCIWSTYHTRYLHMEKINTIIALYLELPSPWREFAENHAVSLFSLELIHFR